MELAMIGLGAMGERMALRLVRDHRLVVFDLDTAAVERLGPRGAIPATDMEGIAAGLSAPRVVWLMLPAGAPTEGTIQEIAPFLEADDVVVDGGNSHYLDSMRRASSLAEQGIHFLDVGTSGGLAGGGRGFSLMIGGPEPIVARLDPIFRSLAAVALVGLLATSAQAGPVDPQSVTYDHTANSSSDALMANLPNSFEHAAGPPSVE